MGTRGRRSILALTGLAGGLLALAGCSVGAYPNDFFQEMHYSPSVRLQEPARMSPPVGAVPFRGVGAEAENIALPAWDLMPLTALLAVTQNPMPNTEVVRQRGEMLFARNCAVCHGKTGDGQGSGLVIAQFAPAGATPPANLLADITKGKSDGVLFYTITHGQGQVPAPADAKNPDAYKELTNMPSFRKLLNAEDRWTLVRHLRALQGQ